MLYNRRRVNYKAMPKGLKGFQKGHSYFVKNRPIGKLNPNWKGGICSDEKKYHREYGKRYREKNKEKIAKRVKEWKKKHRKNVSEASVRWAKRNPEKKAFENNKRRVLRANAKGSHTLEEWKRLKEQYNYSCAICGKREPFIGQKSERLTEDHIIPLSKGGADDIGNIQPLCFSCNCKKYNK